MYKAIFPFFRFANKRIGPASIVPSSQRGLMGSKSRAPGGAGGGGMSWRTVAFLLLAGAIFTTFVAKHQMHQDLHMNFLEVGWGSLPPRGSGCEALLPRSFVWCTVEHYTLTCLLSCLTEIFFAKRLIMIPDEILQTNVNTRAMCPREL